MEPPICPECAQDKHQNCDGTAWDNEHDVLVACECKIVGHTL